MLDGSHAPVARNVQRDAGRGSYADDGDVTVYAVSASTTPAALRDVPATQDPLSESGYSLRWTGFPPRAESRLMAVQHGTSSIWPKWPLDPAAAHMPHTQLAQMSKHQTRILAHAG